MTVSKINRYWMTIAILLVVIIAISSIVAWSRYSPSRPIKISITPPEEYQGKIYIGGAVAFPALYPLKGKDSLETLIRTAGGTTSNVNLNELKLYIPKVGEELEPQKIDINRAEVWLLKALPGIGETLAQRIVDYRQQNGTFHNIHELLKVAGIGTATYQPIEHLITVAD